MAGADAENNVPGTKQTYCRLVPNQQASIGAETSRLLDIVFGTCPSAAPVQRDEPVELDRLPAIFSRFQVLATEQK